MKLALKYGALVALGSFVWIMVEYWLGFRTTNFGIHLSTSLFAVVVLIVGVVLGMRARKRQLGANFTFLRGFTFGLCVALVAGVLMVLGQYLYLQVVDPDYLSRAQAWSTYIQVLDGRSLSEAQASTAASAWKYNVHVRALGQIPYFLVQGIAVSGVTALALARKKS